MIYLRLHGGLGNQLFQLATAISLASGKILIDDRSLSSYRSKRQNGLPSVLNLPDWIEFQKINLTKLRLPRFINNRYLVSDQTPELTAKQYCKLKVIDGYFQDGLTVSFAEQVKHVRPLLKSIKTGDLTQNQCVIHIRGGDFFTTNSPILGPNYYLRQINLMLENGINKFVITTDDKKYATKILNESGRDYQFHDGTVAEDFSLLKNASNKILSNSTFSVWANALSPTPRNVLKDSIYHDSYII
ncbi:alpha-1,2-fucosyltransferase [Paracoccaceae bacterium]|nr:alpha-1,2-fucosyltransferase [Paracoccaceae bacterium]